MPWLTPTVFKQSEQESLIGLPTFAGGQKRPRFRHIVHVYDDKDLPVNTQVQQITFRTMEGAMAFAAPEIPVRCVAVTYPEDLGLVPLGITHAPVLQRFVTDVADFATKRPLPLLFDILGNGLEAQAAFAEEEVCDTAEYIVLTNSDIHLQPYFYRVLAELIGQGWDVLSVNRRTLDVEPGQRGFNPLFLAEPGKEHGGFDCFVFPASMAAQFARTQSCCGVGYVMRSLMFNLVALAPRYLMLTGAHLSFHLGDDRKWQVSAYDEYLDFNLDQARAVITAVAGDPEKLTRLADFIRAHEDDPFKLTVNRLAPRVDPSVGARSAETTSSASCSSAAVAG